uniref:General transcription factor 3C polypeptide 1 n=1 Tax=Enterobius vermicularis TaxID=51028 RepID=A0A0N4VNC8_ENTVE
LFRHFFRQGKRHIIAAEVFFVVFYFYLLVYLIFFFLYFYLYLFIYFLRFERGEGNKEKVLGLHRIRTPGVLRCFEIVYFFWLQIKEIRLELYGDCSKLWVILCDREMASGHSPAVCSMVASSSSVENVPVVGSTRSSASSFNSLSPVCNSTTSSSQWDVPLSRLCLGGEIVAVPSAIIQEVQVLNFDADSAQVLKIESVFRQVITKEAFRSLSSEGQQYLKRFLPRYEGAENDEELILDAAFTDDKNFYFGNSMAKVHSKIRCGYFNPERPSAIVQLRDNRRVLYDHNIRHYYISLLKKLLIARRYFFSVPKLNSLRIFRRDKKKNKWLMLPNLTKLMESFYNTQASEKFPRISPRSALFRKRETVRNLKKRAQYRAKIMLDDIKKEFNDETISSDDEDLPPALIEDINFAGRSTLYNPNFPDLDLHHDISVDEVKDMLKEYRHLKETQPDLPSMDISGITVEDVYQRTKLPCIAERNLTPEVSEAMKQPFRQNK